MLRIKQSKTADTRSCDFSKVTKETLLSSSHQHIGDIRMALDFFKDKIDEAKCGHDFDKITEIDSFHEDFIGGFKSTKWWDRHRKINRHHLSADDGIPEDVNLVDVIEYISDCVMAGMARTGTVFPLEIKPEVLMKAFHNTVDLLKKNIEVEQNESGL